MVNAAASTLGNLGPGAREAAPLLVEALKKDEYHQVPARILQRLGDAAVPALIEGIKDIDNEQASAVLGQLGQQAAPAVPDLVRLLADEHPQVRRRAVQVLGKIAPRVDEAIPALKGAMENTDPAVRREAEGALKRISQGH